MATESHATGPASLYPIHLNIDLITVSVVFHQWPEMLTVQSAAYPLPLCI